MSFRKMSSMGGNWNSLSNWLKSNSVANFLWCYVVYEDITWGSDLWNVVLDTKANKLKTNRLKSSPPFKLAASRGAALQVWVRFMEEVDKRYSKHTLNTIKLQDMCALSWLTSEKRKIYSDELIDSDGDFISILLFIMTYGGMFW